MAGNFHLAGVSVFGSGGKLAVFSLWQKIFITTGKKKISSRLSGRCVSFWFWREIVSFFVAAGKKFVTTGKKKKKLAKHDPPRTLNIPARPLYFIYYSAQPMS